jgi:hypothetical protein
VRLALHLIQKSGRTLMHVVQSHIFTMLSSMTYMKDRWGAGTDYAK